MIVEVQNVSKKINDIYVLRDINASFHGGIVYGIKGRNGSGKTMLMRVICGLVKPSLGNVKIDDKTLGKEISFPDSVGILLETPGFIREYSGFKNLKILSQIKNRVTDYDIRKSMEKVGLDSYLKKSVKKYSLGMKQKLGIAAAIFENPQLLILDEPMNALDEYSIVQVKEIIKEFKANGAIVLIACHDTEDLLELSDEIYIMENGMMKNMER